MKKLDYFTLASMNWDELKDIFHTDLKGYTSEQAEELLEENGPNQIELNKEVSHFDLFIEAYFTPFTLVLLGLALVSFITEYLWVSGPDRDATSAIIIFVLVFVSGTMTFVQSVRSNNAAKALDEMVEVTSTIVRDGKRVEIPTEEIVVGDRILLSAGDMIPADIRLLTTKDLFVSETSLTGESYPVEKIADYQDIKPTSDTGYATLAYMGSEVISGSAEGIVVLAAQDTLFGQIAKAIQAKRTKTSFEEGIDSVSKLLIRFMLVLAPMVFLINGVTKGDWLQALFFGISIAVGLTPEMLPMIVTANLVKGASTMAKEGTVIKNLNSIQNFGAIDTLCTDKTGTLTQDKIILEYHNDVDGNSSDRVLRHAYYNSYFQTGLKNLLDIAIIQATEEQFDENINKYKKVDEIPFDFNRRRMSVVIEDPEHKTQMITKGAIEEMINICTYVEHDAKIYNLDEAERKQILEQVDELNSQGFRVLGLAQKNNPRDVGQLTVVDESEMVLMGYLAFLDPPKEETSEVLEILRERGVSIKILTGDNALVTQAVCKQVNIDSTGYITGQDMLDMSDEELSSHLETTDVFVKLNPAQKARIVKLLRTKGHIVGFLGDGINDSPAMRSADVAISVDNAVDIAKESADVILLKKDLMILKHGIISGRKIFGNIMKYITSTISSNFGNMFSVLAASIFLPFIPMLPMQLLFLNLLYDFSCMSLPWDDVDNDYLMTPKK